MDARLRDQLRLRARRWSALLDPAQDGEARHARLRRSALRARWVELAAQNCARSTLPSEPVAVRQVLTASLRWAFDAVVPELEAALGQSNGDGRFAARHLARLERLRALEATVDGAHLTVAWDLVLTASELRPSAIDDLGEALVRAAASHADTFLRGRIDSALAEVFASGAGSYLQRRGLADAPQAAFWAIVEPAVLFIEPIERVAEVARNGARNLRDWDTVLSEIQARLVGRGVAEDSAQGAVERFLDPRVMAAYLTLPRSDLERLAATTGRRLTLATLTGPRMDAGRDGEAASQTVAPDPDAEGQLIERRSWRALFLGISAALEAGDLKSREVNFMFLAPAIGAGEAWRLAAGDLTKVGSANYHLKRVMEVLRKHVVGAELPLQRFKNPKDPDARTRALVGLFTAGDAPDPFIDALAGVDAEARLRHEPLSPEEIVAFWYLLNLGPDAERTLPSGWPMARAGRLMARAVTHRGWDQRRQLCLLTAVEQVAGAAPPPLRRELGHPEMLFVLANMVQGSPSAVCRMLEGKVTADQRLTRREEAPQLAADLDALELPKTVPQLLSRWLSAADAGPTNEVLTQLGILGRKRAPLPPMTGPLGKRPVERDAQLRLHLRQIMSAL